MKIYQSRINPLNDLKIKYIVKSLDGHRNL